MFWLKFSNDIVFLQCADEFSWYLELSQMLVQSFTQYYPPPHTLSPLDQGYGLRNLMLKFVKSSYRYAWEN